jgi:hypothetical protein
MFAPDDRDRQMVHLGQAFFTICQNYGGFTPLRTTRNVRPRLWYTFLVCVGMSIPLRDFVSLKSNSFRQLFEQNCIEKQVFNGTFT